MYKSMTTSPHRKQWLMSIGFEVLCMYTLLRKACIVADMLHRRDYEDDVSANILAQLIPALRKNPKAKVLVNELIVPSLITPYASADAPASQCLPAAQSGYPTTCHMMSLSTMALMGGKERTFGDIVKIGESAGLRFSRFHQFRMFTGTVEFELPPDSQRPSRL